LSCLAFHVLQQGAGVVLLFPNPFCCFCQFCIEAVLLCPVLLQGVGVALFGDANAANEACGQLSGVQADRRKLELVLMSPDNHISFSCKQVRRDTNLFWAVVRGLEVVSVG
jgi:hypothetical protein